MTEHPEPDTDHTHPSSAAMSAKDVKQWTMFIHFGALAGFVFPFGSIVGPLILWQIKKDESPDIDEHGRMVVNAMITYLCYFIASFVLTFILIGIPMLLAVMALSFICSILGGIKANDGTLWKYPLSFKFV